MIEISYQQNIIVFTDHIYAKHFLQIFLKGRLQNFYLLIYMENNYSKKQNVSFVEGILQNHFVHTFEACTKLAFRVGEPSISLSQIGTNFFHRDGQNRLLRRRRCIFLSFFLPPQGSACSLQRMPAFELLCAVGVRRKRQDPRQCYNPLDQKVGG